MTSIRPFALRDTESVIALWQETGLTRSWNNPHLDIQRKLRVQPELFLVAVDDADDVIGSVMATKGVTALLILATLFTPLTEMMIVLPVLGVVLNGTSSVLYGVVPDLASKGDLGRAFAVFYTFVSGSGGLAPIAYGAIADVGGQTVGVLATVATTVLIVPLALSLRPALRR